MKTTKSIGEEVGGTRETLDGEFGPIQFTFLFPPKRGRSFRRTWNFPYDRDECGNRKRSSLPGTNLSFV